MEANVKKPHILYEVFGYPSIDFSDEAKKARKERLCPFKGGSEKCTKDKASDPLGVCTLEWEEKPIIVCPYRFLGIPDLLGTIAQELLGTTNFQLLPEVPLKNAADQIVGNLDSVLIFSKDGEIKDFVGVEFQSVYISQNLRRYFDLYNENPEEFISNKPALKTRPRPDFLSSVKRLNYQLLYKGAIFSAWQKKIAVVLQQPLWDTISSRGSGISEVDLQSPECHIVWYIVDYEGPLLVIKKKLCVSFSEFKNKFFNIDPQSVENFVEYLSGKLKDALSRGGD